MKKKNFIELTTSEAKSNAKDRRAEKMMIYDFYFLAQNQPVNWMKLISIFSLAEEPDEIFQFIPSLSSSTFLKAEMFAGVFFGKGNYLPCQHIDSIQK